jgi:predicted nucleic acid-binding protein
MIAGIVISSGAMLAARNVSHFDGWSTSVINPWQM